MMAGGRGRLGRAKGGGVKEIAGGRMEMVGMD